MYIQGKRVSELNIKNGEKYMKNILKKRGLHVIWYIYCTTYYPVCNVQKYPTNCNFNVKVWSRNFGLKTYTKKSAFTPRVYHHHHRSRGSSLCLSTVVSLSVSGCSKKMCHIFNIITSLSYMPLTMGGSWWWLGDGGSILFSHVGVSQLSYDVLTMFFAFISSLVCWVETAE